MINKTKILFSFIGGILYASLMWFVFSFSDQAIADPATGVVQNEVLAMLMPAIVITAVLSSVLAVALIAIYVISLFGSD